MQNVLKKLSTQAGHEEIMPSASFKFFFKESIYFSQNIVSNKDRAGIYTYLHTCSSRQQTGPSVHLFPHSATSFSLVVLSGSRASPLSGQGRSPPKMLFFPQWPRIAHLPGSCMAVSPCAATAEKSAPQSKAVANLRRPLMLTATY